MLIIPCYNNKKHFVNSETRGHLLGFPLIKLSTARRKKELKDSEDDEIMIINAAHYI